jgi:hypothetical protein
MFLTQWPQHITNRNDIVCEMVESYSRAHGSLGSTEGMKVLKTNHSEYKGRSVFRYLPNHSLESAPTHSARRQNVAGKDLP